MYSPPTHHQGAHTVQSDSNGEGQIRHEIATETMFAGEILIATYFALVSVLKHPTSFGSLQLSFPSEIDIFF